MAANCIYQQTTAYFRRSVPVQDGAATNLNRKESYRTMTMRSW